MMRLLYISRSTIRAQDRLRELRSIRISSTRQNSVSGITGMLIFERDRFAQILEGDRLAVTEAFTRIASDDRHADVTLLEAAEGHERCFLSWRMRLVTFAPKNALIFQRFAIDGEFRPELMEADKIAEMMLVLAASSVAAPGEKAMH